MKSLESDTIAALATAPGKSGVCVVRISGPLAKDIATSLLGYEPKPRYAHYGNFTAANGQLLDQGLGLFFAGPASFTGEDVFEIQGHGGTSVQNLLLSRALELGARLARPGEFSERAFLNDKIDLVQAEAIADLIDASSTQAAQSALRTLSGEFSNLVHQLVSELTKTRVNIEAAIDFSDEDIDVISDTRVHDSLEQLSLQLATTLQQANQGSLLKEGMQVVIAGKPNAGKSSLLNALSGSDTAIVTDIAGTTRDLLSERLQIDGMPIHITDTAGLRESDDVVEQEGVKRASAAMKASDRILLVIDAAQPRPEGLTLCLDDIPTLLQEQPKLLGKTLVVWNKADLLDDTNFGHLSCALPKELFSQASKTQAAESVVLSAKNQDGLDALRDILKRVIGFNASVEGAFVARERHLVALRCAASLVHSAQRALIDGQPFELAAEDLRLAQQELGRITGEVSSDDLLGEIFSNFCVGK